MITSVPDELVPMLAEVGVMMPPGLVNQLHVETVVEGPFDFMAGVDNTSPARLGAFSYSHSTISRQITSVGRYCSISEHVSFGASNHPSTWLTASPFSYDPRHSPFAAHRARLGRGYTIVDWGFDDEEYGGGVRVGNDVWIGAGAYVRGGVSLGDGCIVGTKAVVTKDVPPYAVVVGNPGRVVKTRVPTDLVDDLLELRWWDYDFTSFEGIDLRDPRRAASQLRQRKEDGLLTPIVPLPPVGVLVEELLAALGGAR